MNSVYVPIVKGKVNDLMGAGLLKNHLRNSVKPFVEAMPIHQDRPSVDAHVVRLCEHIKRHLPLGDLFVDFYGLMPDAKTSDGVNAAISGFRFLKGIGRHVTPAYGFERNDAIWEVLGNVAKEHERGFCFRVSRDDLTTYSSDEVWQQIVERTAQLKLAPGQIDVLLDLRSVADTDIRSLQELVTTFLADNSRAGDYRSLIVAGSSALKEVGSIDKDDSADVVRAELLLWSTLWRDLPEDRRLTFSDYGIVHPDFSDQAPNKFMNAKIRYTAGDKIVYHRGHGLLHPHKDFDQYHALAARACRDGRYIDRSYSFGDAYLQDCANKLVKAGSAATWVKVDMNHHISYTANQLVRLQADLLLAETDQEAESFVSTI